MSVEALPGPERRRQIGEQARVAIGPHSHPVRDPDRALTDLGNAARFARDHGDVVRYCPALGWLTWDSARWRRDETGEVERRARDTVRSIHSEAARELDSARRREVSRWAIDSESLRRIQAMLSLARSELGIAMSASVFDRDAWALNTPSGVVNLRTGHVSAPDSACCITKVASTFYSTAEDTAPQWLTFLDQAMAHDLEMVEFLQRAVGYSITGDTSEQVLFLLHGTGANGKSVFLETLRRVLGDYAINAAAETFLTKPAGSIPNDIARLHGARFVTAVETEDGRRLAEALVKQMTGGDTITARYLHREFFEFVPTFKVWLATNHKPRIIGTDYAIWRRIRLIPFTVTIEPTARDPRLVEKLVAEARGILSWAVQGCLLWQQCGLAPPRQVVMATDTYRDENDSLGAFIADECVTVAGLQGRGLYPAYKTWAENNGFSPLNATTFSLRLQTKGYQTGRDRRGRFFVGLGLASEVDP